MKYILELTSKVGVLCPLEERHKAIIKKLTTIPKPWGIETGDYPTPEFGKGLTAVFPLGKHLGSGIKGNIIYAYRRSQSVGDLVATDRISINFNPEKFILDDLAPDILKAYIDFFEPFNAQIFNEDVIYYDYQNFRGKSSLFYSFRFYQINYWSTDFCRETLKIEPEKLMSKIFNFVEHVELFKDGIIIIATKKMLNLEETNKIDKQLKLHIGIWE